MNHQAERRARGGRLQERLAADVAKIVPKSIAGWERAWSIVAPSYAAFLVALTRWESTGLDDHKPPLRAAYFSVLDAWRRATEEYEGERAGR